jgi:hypothetical protein
MPTGAKNVIYRLVVLLVEEDDPWWYHDITDGVSQLFLSNPNLLTGGGGEETEHFDF